MKNKFLNVKSFEVIIMILLLLIITTVLLTSILSVADNQKLKTMRNSAINIKNTVMNNHVDFHDMKKIYLGELIDDKLISEVKSPVSKGNCSSSESYVEKIEGKYKVTLKCGNYVFQDKSNITDEEGVFYRVTDWSENKDSNDNDQIKLYNCLVNGKEKYANYYEDNYFLYMASMDFNKEYTSVSQIDSNTCKVVTKTFYREKELSKQ